VAVFRDDHGCFLKKTKILTLSVVCCDNQGRRINVQAFEIRLMTYEKVMKFFKRYRKLAGTNRGYHFSVFRT
jgi:hypothetical protein